MKFYFEILGLTGALPCVVALCMAAGCQKFGKAPAFRHAGALTFAVAFCIAWFSLPWIPWTVNSSWQWLPWLTLMTALVFSTAESARARWWEWLALVIAMATVCAVAVVPMWDDMEPSRPIAMGVVVTICVFVVVACENLTRRLHAALLSGLLMLCGFGSCVLSGLAGSLKFAQLGSAMTAATAGCLLVSWQTGDRAAIRTLAPVFLIAITCLNYSTYANSFAGIPWTAFVLVAIAMSAGSLIMIPPLNRMSGYKRVLLPIALVGMPLVIGILIAVQAAD